MSLNYRKTASNRQTAGGEMP